MASLVRKLFSVTTVSFRRTNIRLVSSKSDAQKKEEEQKVPKEELEDQIKKSTSNRIIR